MNEDVTEFVQLKQKGTEQHKLTQELRARAEQMESEMVLRTRLLDEANAQLRQAHEEMEHRVEERTAELEAALKDKECLLRDLERSKLELQDKITDLEKFEEVVVGRELKMIALEQEVRRLTCDGEGSPVVSYNLEASTKPNRNRQKHPLDQATTTPLRFISS